MIENIGLVLLAGAVFGTVASQSLLDLCLSVLVIIWTFKFASKTTRNTSKLGLLGIEWAFLGYFIVIAAGFLFNASPEAEIVRSFSKLSWMLYLYILIYSFQNISFNSMQIIRYFSLWFLIPNIYAIIGYINGFDFLTGRESDRVVGLLNSATYHAHANAVLFVFFSSCLLFGFKKLNNKMKIISMIALFIFGLGILLTFTRGIWLSIFFSSVLIGYIVNFRKTVLLTGLALLFGFITFIAWPKFHDRVLNSLNTTANSERINLFKVNVQVWQEYPLLGIGYGENLRRNREYWDRPEWKMPEDYITSHAHNQYLNVLACTGIFGLVFFLSFISFFVRKNWKLLKRTSFDRTPFRYSILLACFWAQIEYLMACVTDVTFEYAKIRALLILVWALVVAIEIKPEILIEENNS